MGVEASERETKPTDDYSKANIVRNLFKSSKMLRRKMPYDEITLFWCCRS